MFTKAKGTKNAFPDISHFQHEGGKLILEISFCGELVYITDFDYFKGLVLDSV
jgi:hypothetical protein